jgi:MFS family permease
MTTAQEYLDKRWTALILLCVAQFIVVLDASIVNVALPSIGKGLDFSEENLPWIVNSCSEDGRQTCSAGAASS